MITYHTEGTVMPSIKKRETTAWVRAVAATYGKKVGDVSYIFCNDKRILEVNREFLQHDYYTDIITFDYTEGDIITRVPQMSPSIPGKPVFPALPRLSSRGSTHTTVARGTAL